MVAYARLRVINLRARVDRLARALRLSEASWLDLASLFEETLVRRR